MSRIKLGIVAKGLIVVAIPLVFSCYFVGTMVNLQWQAERAALRAEHARAISTLINSLIHDLYIGMGSITLKVEKFSAGQDRQARIEAAKAKIHQLIELIGPEDRQDLTTLKALEAIVDRGNNLVARAEQAYIEGNKAEVVRLREESKSLSGHVISPELIALGDRQKDLFAKDNVRQSELRGEMRTQLWSSLFVSIVGTVALAFFVTRSITRRLAYLTDHSRRIARGEELVLAIGGSDEIAELDLVLHKMASEIESLLQRERIILENAADIICVADRKLKILKISPSVSAVLGVEPQALLGESCLTLVDRDRSPQAVSAILRAVGGSAVSSFEAVLTKSSGQSLDFLVSLSFVAGEEILILIFHDITSLKDAERFKQHVVSMVSHDLRSPLTAVSHILEMFDEGMFGELNQEGKSMLGRAEQSTKQMSVLVSDLLELDKIESGKLHLAKNNVTSKELLERAQMLCLDLAEKGECRVRIDRSEGVAYCDADRVNQVLTNLIGNALKYSKPGDEVVISAELSSPTIRFSVRDRGPGIPPSKQELIFERFAQVKADDQKTGVGFGLAICKALVELHGGTIALESDGQTGSCFYFTLPEAALQ